MFISNTILLYSAAGVGVVFLILLIWIIRIHVKLKRILIGKNAHNIEDSLMSLLGTNKDLVQFTKDMEQYLTTVEKRLKNSIQSIETIRFNPFKGTGSGGNNSFSTAYLNEYGNGVVLTSMYSRDRISMFAKPVKNFTSTYELSDEERQSIEQCRTTLQAQ